MVVAVIILFGIGWKNALAYLIGSACSAAAGYAGMYVSTRANARVAWAARSGLKKAFPVAFYAGAVMGLSVVGVGPHRHDAALYDLPRPRIVLGFSFGASSLALLAKAGGGIYTKTADIGADLVGKVEFGLAEDDPRNPAVIADNVGDNVGDVAGMGADIFDSFVASVVAVMILGYELYAGQSELTAQQYMVYPLLLCAVGIFASLIGMLVVRTGESNDPGRALNTGTVVTTAILAVFTLVVVFALGLDHPWGVFWPTVAGLRRGRGHRLHLGLFHRHRSEGRAEHGQRCQDRRRASSSWRAFPTAC